MRLTTATWPGRREIADRYASSLAIIDPRPGRRFRGPDPHVGAPPLWSDEPSSESDHKSEVRRFGMDAGGGEPWIPTERTHSLYLIQTVGAWPILAAVLVYVWYAVYVPQYGVLDSVLIEVGTAIVLAVFSAVSWMVFRPSAVRASARGIEIRRPVGAVLRVPADEVALYSRPPAGFGLVKGTAGRLGFILSPDQFAAAKRYFPVTHPGAQPTARPLS
jgi:hypothetical protein